MTTPDNPSGISDRELVLTRLIDAPREKVFRAWAEPELLQQWFTPALWTTPLAATDVRPGGSCLIVMRDPDGNEFPIRGVYLEVVQNERLVFTDTYTRAWEPSEKPFMTVILTFENEGGKTRYTARVRHWTIADREMHETMGFHGIVSNSRRGTFCFRGMTVPRKMQRGGREPGRKLTPARSTPARTVA